MKKQLTTFAVLLFSSLVLAQNENENSDNRLANIDWKEDTVEIVTVKDIIKTQQNITKRAALAGHYAKVWSKRGFFNVAYHTKATLEPQEAIETGLGATGYNNGKVPKFTADWGASIMVGKNIKLHKKPIANTLTFNLDYTGVDLTFNKYSAEPGLNNDHKNIYNSDDALRRHINNDDGTSNDYYYLHWNLEKYEVSYGMTFGPSITLAPFNYVYGANGLHFLKFNFYYHIGYNASFLLMIGDIESDTQFGQLPAKGNSKYKSAKENLEERNENQFILGHGLYQTLGFNVTWKRFGLGYEHRWGGLKYKNLVAKTEYGSDSYKFDSTTNRIYLSYRFGSK